MDNGNEMSVDNRNLEHDSGAVADPSRNPVTAMHLLWFNSTAQSSYRKDTMNYF